jgi:hypothetical protein
LNGRKDSQYGFIPIAFFEKQYYWATEITDEKNERQKKRQTPKEVPCSRGNAHISPSAWKLLQ